MFPNNPTFFGATINKSQLLRLLPAQDLCLLSLFLSLVARAASGQGNCISLFSALGVGVEDGEGGDADLPRRIDGFRNSACRNRETEAAR